MKDKIKNSRKENYNNKTSSSTKNLNAKNNEENINEKTNIQTSQNNRLINYFPLSEYSFNNDSLQYYYIDNDYFLDNLNKDDYPSINSISDINNNLQV